MKNLFFFLLTIMIISCQEKTKSDDKPTVTTTAITNITGYSATSGGNVASDGGDLVTARGVCWSTSHDPEVSGNHTSDDIGVGAYFSSIIGLSPNTQYYVRAYATNGEGTAYGEEIGFTTNSTQPTVTTAAISGITVNSATGGGNVLSDSGSAVTARGVCWSTSQNPTIANSHTTDGSGTGDFVSSITGLTVATTYYVRAYATNNWGTAYGNQVSFSNNYLTGTFTDTRDGHVYKTVQIGSQVWMTENLDYRTASGSWYYSDDSITYAAAYGRLYDWSTALTIAPTGWHLPTKQEWVELFSTNNSPQDLGNGLLRWGSSTLVWFLDGGGSKFNALTGGMRDSNNVSTYIDTLGQYWSTASFDAQEATYAHFNKYINGLYINHSYKSYGFSVRCIKD